MKIIDIKLAHLHIPLRKSFITALRTVTHVDDVLVKIYTDTGAVGYGSAAPTPSITGDTGESITVALGGRMMSLGGGVERALSPKLACGENRRLRRCCAAPPSSPSFLLPSP